MKNKNLYLASGYETIVRIGKTDKQALEKLMENKTAIVIAHRLSTIKNADRILVMDGGTIVEEGSHEELLEKEGIYAKMFKIQFGELAKSLNSCHPDKI